MTYFDFLQGKFIEETKKRKSPEAAVGRAIDKYLASIGVYVRTIKSDGTKTKEGWRKSTQGRGISDRIGILPTGKFLAVELKAPGKKSTLTEDQYRFLYAVASRRGTACVADCVEDVKLCLEQSQEDMLSTLLKWKPKTESCQDLDSLPDFG